MATINTHLNRPRLSIAPALKLGALWVIGLGAASKMALRVSAAIATRHEVPLFNLVIRTLTKSY